MPIGELWWFTTLNSVCLSYNGKMGNLISLKIISPEQYKEQLQTKLYEQQEEILRRKRYLEESEKNAALILSQLEQADETYEKHLRLEWD